MKYIPPQTVSGRIPSLPVLELTRRNLETLLEKLDDPDSARTLVDGAGMIAVRAVENEEHYAERAPGITKTNGVFK